MTGIVDTLISGIVRSAMSEILRKTSGRSTTTKRTRRKARSSTSLATPSTRSRSKKKPGPVAGTSGRGAGAKKQVSKRRTSAARSKARRR